MPAPHHSVFLQAGCPSCCPTNSVKALKAQYHYPTDLADNENNLKTTAMTSAGKQTTTTTTIILK